MRSSQNSSNSLEPKQLLVRLQELIQQQVEHESHNRCGSLSMHNLVPPPPAACVSPEQETHLREAFRFENQSPVIWQCSTPGTVTPSSISCEAFCGNSPSASQFLLSPNSPLLHCLTTQTPPTVSPSPPLSYSSISRELANQSMSAALLALLGDPNLTQALIPQTNSSTTCISPGFDGVSSSPLSPQLAQMLSGQMKFWPPRNLLDSQTPVLPAHQCHFQPFRESSAQNFIPPPSAHFTMPLGMTSSTTTTTTVGSVTSSCTSTITVSPPRGSPLHSPIVSDNSASDIPSPECLTLPEACTRVNGSSRTELLLTKGSASRRYVDITEYLCMPQKDAAAKLGMKNTTLSKHFAAVVHKERKWPYRRIKQLDKEILLAKSSVPAGMPVPPGVEEKIRVLTAKRQLELKPVVIAL